MLGCMGVGGGGMLNGGMYHDCNIFRQVIDHSGPGSAVESPFRSTKTLRVKMWLGYIGEGRVGARGERG